MKRIDDIELADLVDRINSGRSIDGDVLEDDLVLDLWKARQEIRKIKRKNREMKQELGDLEKLRKLYYGHP